MAQSLAQIHIFRTKGGMLVKMFVVLMVLFGMQKLYFMALTWQGQTWHEVMQVLWNGMPLDASTAAYILIVPWLLCLADSIRRIPLRTAMRCYIAFIAILSAVAIVADASLYTFWHFKLDVSVFAYTDKPKDAMASVDTTYIMQRVMWIVIWCYAFIRSLFLVVPSSVVAPSNMSRYHKVAMYLLSAAVMVVMIRGGVGKGTANVSNAYFCDNQYLNHCAVNPMFNFMYSMNKSEDFAAKAQYFTDKECETLVRDIYPAVYGENKVGVTDSLLNGGTRPDILLIIWEGGGHHVTHDFGAAPNLMALEKEGVVFTQCYANSFRTDRGQLSLISGWPAIPKTSLMKIPEKCEHLSALPRSLVAAGYQTRYWYGGDITFTNTGGYMLQAGFQRTVSDKDLSRKQLESEWGAYDGTMMNLVGDHMLQGNGDRSPMFNCLMTITSHEPWEAPVKKFDDKRLNCFYYTDKCIGELISRLKKSPRWKNTLVIITADHGIEFDDAPALFMPSVTHIPMVWCGGAIKEHRVIDKIMNQSDLAATLLSQLGIAHEEFVFSRNVMSSAYTYPTAFHAFNGGISFTDSTGYTMYDIDGDRTLIPGHNRDKKAKAILQTLYRKVAEL